MEVFEKLLVILDSLPSVTNVVVVGHLVRSRQPEIPFPQERKGRTWQSWREVVESGQRTAKKDIDFWIGPAMSPIYGEPWSELISSQLYEWLIYDE